MVEVNQVKYPRGGSENKANTLFTFVSSRLGTASRPVTMLGFHDINICNLGVSFKH